MSRKQMVVAIPKNQDKGYMFETVWRQSAPEGLPPMTPEYVFNAPHSRHRFDRAWPEQKIAVEIDGGNHLVRYGQNGRPYAVGRHTGDGDYRKRNLATSLGWRVFFFTPQMIEDDPVGCVMLVVDALCPDGTIFVAQPDLVETLNSVRKGRKAKNG